MQNIFIHKSCSSWQCVQGRTQPACNWPKLFRPQLSCHDIAELKSMKAPMCGLMQKWEPDQRSLPRRQRSRQSQALPRIAAQELFTMEKATSFLCELLRKCFCFLLKRIFQKAYLECLKAHASLSTSEGRSDAYMKVQSSLQVWIKRVPSVLGLAFQVSRLPCRLSACLETSDYWKCLLKQRVCQAACPGTLFHSKLFFCADSGYTLTPCLMVSLISVPLASLLEVRVIPYLSCPFHPFLLFQLYPTPCSKISSRPNKLSLRRW